MNIPTLMQLRQPSNEVILAKPLEGCILSKGFVGFSEDPHGFPRGTSCFILTMTKNAFDLKTCFKTKREVMILKSAWKDSGKIIVAFLLWMNSNDFTSNLPLALHVRNFGRTFVYQHMTGSMSELEYAGVKNEKNLEICRCY